MRVLLAVPHEVLRQEAEVVENLIGGEGEARRRGDDGGCVRSRRDPPPGVLSLIRVRTRVVPGAFPSRSREIIIVAIVVLLETTVVVEPEGGANVALEEATRAGSAGVAQDAPGPRVEALARGEG